MKAIFITGTDTGVGKTMVTHCLARYISAKGYKVATQKWIETGCRSNVSVNIKAPYRFKHASSPHLAAKLEHKIIRPEKIISDFKVLAQGYDFVIVEGTGGALVPFSKKHLIIDIARGLKFPVLLVVANKLGAINHTLLTIEALKTRKMNILGIIFNNFKGQNKKVLMDNPRIIKALTPENIFGILPWIEDRNKLYKKFITVGEKIWISGLRKI